MPSEDTDLYVICDTGGIERGDAKAFSLSRVGDNGESRPFPIFVVRTLADTYYGYVNVCPHGGTWLNIGAGAFYSRDRGFLRCGRHGALFEIDSGLCIEGDCRGKSLEPVAIAVVDGDVCVLGVTLAEDEGPDPFSDSDDTMEITIHP